MLFVIIQPTVDDYSSACSICWPDLCMPVYYWIISTMDIIRVHIIRLNSNLKHLCYWWNIHTHTPSYMPLHCSIRNILPYWAYRAVYMNWALGNCSVLSFNSVHSIFLHIHIISSGIHQKLEAHFATSQNNCLVRYLKSLCFVSVWFACICVGRQHHLELFVISKHIFPVRQ